MKIVLLSFTVMMLFGSCIEQRNEHNGSAPAAQHTSASPAARGTASTDPTPSQAN